MNIKRNLKSRHILRVGNKLERLKYIQHLSSYNFKTRRKKNKTRNEGPTLIQKYRLANYYLIEANTITSVTIKNIKVITLLGASFEPIPTHCTARSIS